VDQATLANLDRASAVEPQILTHFADEMLLLMPSTDEECSGLAYSLMLRLLSYAPQMAGTFAPLFLKCLDASDPRVCQPALQRVPDFFLAAPGHSSALLSHVFAVSARGGFDIGPTLRDVLQSLHLS
jgi:hypothetical protein